MTLKWEEIKERCYQETINRPQANGEKRIQIWIKDKSTQNMSEIDSSLPEEKKWVDKFES